MNAPLPSWTSHTVEAAPSVYSRAVRRHWLVVVAVTAAALLASVAWLALRPAEYEGKAQVLVSPLSSDSPTFAGLQVLRESGDDPTRPLETAATLLRSPQAAERTARLMGPGWDAERVLDQVEVRPRSQSNILEVVGKTDRAEQAARLANSFATAALRVRADALERQVEAILERLRARQESFQGGVQTAPGAASVDLTARISELEAIREGGDPTLSLTRTASVPTSEAGAAAPIVVALSLIAGLTLGIAAAILLEMLNRRVRDEDEATELYNLPVLARVPLLRRRNDGQTRNGGASVMPPAIHEAFRTVLAQLMAGDHKRTQSIMVTSASTGDGKTMSAVSLAMALSTAGHKVLLLDMDMRKPDVARVLGVKAEPLASLVTVDDLGKNFARLFREVPGVSTLSVLATSGVGENRTRPAEQAQNQIPLDLAEARNIRLVEMLHERVPALLAEARAAADYVVVDTPPLGEFSDALRIARDVDGVIVVVRPRHTDRRSFEVMRDLLNRTGNVPAGMLVIGGDATVHARYYDRGARRPASQRVLARLRG